MNKLETKTLLQMFESGRNNVANHVDEINNLNVFPVPDGDTGSNMSSTITIAFEKIKSLPSSTPAYRLCKVFAKESLLGARGNSGVILSQIFKGFAAPMKTKETLSAQDIIEALAQAKISAYESVIKPIEGTILTVIKDIALGTKKLNTNNLTIVELFHHIVKIGNKSLDNTPNLLPILKEVNVVDSGGKGLMVFFEGMLSGLEGKVIKEDADKSNVSSSTFIMKKEIFDGEFGFCTEFIINLDIKKEDKKPYLLSFKQKPFNKKEFLQAIKKMGATSEVVVRDEEILKVHCHILTPIKLLSYAEKFGVIFKIKVENMNQQAITNKANPNAKNNDSPLITNKLSKGSVGIISCNNGQGIIEDIKSYGAHFIIEGGQTMNPSAGDFAKAIKALDSKEIIILPNNSNVILSATQAAKTTKNKKVVVLPTKTQIQGMVAMIQYNHEGTLQENVEEMKEAISEVKSIAITQATRNARINKVKIKKGDYMAILNGKIVLTHKSKIQVAINVLKKNMDEMSEIVTIYTGLDASLADGEEILSTIEGEQDVEAIAKNGGQPTYDFLISIE